jgi:hypothetical protein
MRSWSDDATWCFPVRHNGCEKTRAHRSSFFSTGRYQQKIGDDDNGLRMNENENENENESPSEVETAMMMKSEPENEKDATPRMMKYRFRFPSDRLDVHYVH